MPYILSPKIHNKLPGLWGEGEPYASRIIYDIHSAQLSHPPVHYCEHTVKPHSITHIDFPGHIIPEGKSVESYFTEEGIRSFYGDVVVIKLLGKGWRTEGDVWIWRVTRSELEQNLLRVMGSAKIPHKLFLSAIDVPITPDGFHDPRYVLVLEEEAAKWLVSEPKFNAFGTSWKSCDYQPGSRERPVHRILLSQAVLYEYLALSGVPEGSYWLTGFPLNLEAATESPVTPILFHKDER